MASLDIHHRAGTTGTELMLIMIALALEEIAAGQDQGIGSGEMTTKTDIRAQKVATRTGIERTTVTTQAHPEEVRTTIGDGMPTKTMTGAIATDRTIYNYKRDDKCKVEDSIFEIANRDTRRCPSIPFPTNSKPVRPY